MLLTEFKLKFQLSIFTNKKVLFLKKICTMLVFETLKNKKSSFLNSNTCFCSRLYGNTKSTYKVFKIWLSTDCRMALTYSPVASDKIWATSHLFTLSKWYHLVSYLNCKRVKKSAANFNLTKLFQLQNVAGINLWYIIKILLQKAAPSDRGLRHSNSWKKRWFKPGLCQSLLLILFREFQLVDWQN